MNEPLPKSFFVIENVLFLFFLVFSLKMHDTQVSFIWMKELQNKIK